MISEDRYKNDSIEDFKKDFTYKIERLETLKIYIPENGPKILKTKFPDEENYFSKKLADPDEYFININDYQKPVNNLQKKTSLAN